MNDFRMCVALLGLSAVAQLAALIPIGAFTGLHRNIVPVSIQMAVRFTSLAALWGVSQVGGGLLALSITLAVCGFMVVPATFGTARRLAGQMFEKFPPLDRERVNAMLKDCMGLAVWSVAMLLVGGLDVVIVGHFDFAKVAAFSLASTAVTIFVGVLQAMLNPLIALGSSMTARKGGGGGLDRLLVVSTHSCAAFLVSITLLFALIGHFVLPYWVSKTYVEDVYSFLLVLLIAQSVRNLMAPYSVLLVSVRRQREALVPAIVEGLVNLVCSVYLVNKLGAMGAAYGTLIGAIVGVLAFVLLVVHRTRELVKSRLQFVTRVLVLPLFSLVAVFLLSVR